MMIDDGANDDDDAGGDDDDDDDDDGSGGGGDDDDDDDYDDVNIVVVAQSDSALPTQKCYSQCWFATNPPCVLITLNADPLFSQLSFGNFSR